MGTAAFNPRLMAAWPEGPMKRGARVGHRERHGHYLAAYTVLSSDGAEHYSLCCDVTSWVVTFGPGARGNRPASKPMKYKDLADAIRSFNGRWASTGIYAELPDGKRKALIVGNRTTKLGELVGV